MRHVHQGRTVGQGIAALPVVFADAAPVLRRVRMDEDPPSKPVFLAMHRDMRSVPRVRAFADALAKEAAQALGGIK